MTEPYWIDGPGADVQPRLEIRDLQNNTEQFALFILSLSTIMQPEYRPKAARFGDLGGIHGLPYERWSGDPAAPDALPEGTWGGYCNHGSVLFPTWHRPYVLGLEQSIREAAIRFAQRWTKHVDDDVKLLWTTAASNLRFPFWDWTDLRAKTDGLPDVLKPQIFIFTLPDGTQSDPVENPLSQYEFGSTTPDGFQDTIWNTPLAPSDISFFEKWSRTYRWPSSKLNPIEAYVKIDQLLAGDVTQRGSCDQLRAQVSKLFTCSTPESIDDGQESYIWDEFSNTTFQSKDNTKWKPQGIGSLESPHNSVHLLIGGLGDMADNDYAGFDPIFYLHHCNVDRILAFWEYTYHTYWVGTGYENKNGDIVPFTQDGGTWEEEDDATIDETSELQPFRYKATTNYWNSLDTRFLNDAQTFQKGYTYPDIVETINDETITVSLTKDFPETEQDIENCMAALQAHFGQSQPSSDKKLALEIGPVPRGHDAIPSYRRFFISVELIGHAFGGSYGLQLIYKDTVVSSFAVLSRGDNTQCAACKIHAKAGGQVRGVIDIPDDVIYDISSDAPAPPPGGSVLQNTVSAIRSSFRVRLVNPGGSVLADAVTPTNKSQFTRGKSGGVPLDPGIVPKLELRSAAAMRRRRTGNQRSQAPLKFFDHQSHNALLGNHKWRTA